MFTGLVADLGTVLAADAGGDGVRLTVRSTLAGSLAEGDSVAVNGVCLTATAVDGDSFRTDVMNQTLATSSLAGLRAGSPVNLELPLRAADRLGGHVVQGHVDGVGTVTELRDDGFARRLTVALPESLARYVALKGSIAVDGVSLTVADADSRSFTVSLIPETLARTTLGVAGAGDEVNLEVDILAKYVERLVSR